MSKRVVILSGSPRRHGNSDTLCDEFQRGAEEAGHHVTKVFLRDKDIHYCNGCWSCRESSRCVIHDDMEELLELISAADVLVLASPVYFYAIDAQMKTVIDRCVARWLQLKNKEFYYILTAADDSESAMEGPLACFHGFAVCLEGSKERGVLFGKGLQEKEDVQASPYRAQAYEMGKGV